MTRISPAFKINCVAIALWVALLIESPSAWRVGGLLYQTVCLIASVLYTGRAKGGGHG